MSLEDFHTKALRLVKEAEYPDSDTQNRVLRDTIISGLAFDKICAKVIKEGKDVTLARVMEIARLEVSTQQHIDRMQETAQGSIMCSIARDLRRRRADPDPVTAVVAAAAVVAILPRMENPPIRKEMEGNPHYLLTSAGDAENLDIRKVNHAKQWK